MGEQVGFNFLDNADCSSDTELLEFVHDVIEENVLINLINKFIDEDADYFKAKEREIRWLAAKARFRAIQD